jgi:OmpA-OmpF porin, OOP family
MFLLCVLLAVIPAVAQRLEPDAAGCSDSKVLPKLQMCRIDNCEKQDSDHRDLPVSDNGQGEPATAPVDGDSRSVMYECAVGTTPASVIGQAAAALKAAGFEVPYQFADKEGDLTAHKGDIWISVEAAARFYTLVEMKAASDLDSASDAVAMAETIRHYGHVPAYGIQFLSGKADLTPESTVALHEIAALLEDNAEWRIRVVGHTDSTGDKDANLALSMRRATAVVNWLVVHGVKRPRLEVAGAGDAEPVAPNDSEANRARNRRIELVKLQ